MPKGKKVKKVEEEIVETPVAEVEETVVVAETPAGEETVLYWEGHKVVQQGQSRMVGDQKMYSCLCDDGCTYDIPAEFIEV